MTHYQNSQIPEGINVSKVHPLKDFCILLTGVGGIIIVLVLLSAMLAEQLVRYISFDTEQLLSEQLITQLIPQENGSSKQQNIEQYLQTLADSLAEKQQLADEIKITIHYADDDVINAFASLGGHIFIHRGLLEIMPNENTLAMVLSHEIAHIKYRHPLIAMGRGLSLAAVMLSLAGATDSSVFERLIGEIGLITSLSFSREHERQADSSALQTLWQHYGHNKGATTLFTLLEKQHNAVQAPAFLSTHPLSEDRIVSIRKFQTLHNSSPTETFTQLPAFITQLK